MKIWILVLVLLVSQVISNQAIGQVQLTVDKAHIAGVYQAHKATVESWLSGDVLVQYRINGNGRLTFVPLGPESLSLMSEMSGYTRFIFDHEQKRYVVVNRKKTVTNLFDGLDNEIGVPTHSADDTAGVYDKFKDISLKRLADGTIQDLRRLTEDENRFLGAAPQLAGIGCTTYSGIGWRPFSEVFAAMDQYGHVDIIKTVDNVGNNRYRVQSVMEDKSIMPGGTRVETEWDVKRQVPIKFAHFAGPKLDPEKAFTINPLHTCTVEWTEVAGQLLPTLGRGSYKQPVNFDDRQFGVQYEFQIKIHWFSVNEVIPDETFDPAVLKDLAKLSELVDGKWFEE